MKRKKNEFEEVSHKNKQLKNEYKSGTEENDDQPVTDEALWNAAYIAGYHNQPDQYFRLLKSVKNPEKLNWNHTSKDEKHPGRGITLAWMTIKLEGQGKSALLKALLQSSGQLSALNWNAAPQDEKHPERGITLAWRATMLASRGKPELLNALLQSPGQLHTLNWNAAPQYEKHPYRGVTLAWRATTLANQGNPELLNALLQSPGQLHTLNWNAAPQYEKHPYRGVTLAWRATTLANQGNPELLNALLQSPGQLKTINWNAAPRGETDPNRGVTLAELFAGLFGQNIPFHEPLIHSWSLPALTSLQAVLKNKPPSRLSWYVDFLVKLAEFSQTPDTINSLEEEAKSHRDDHFDNDLQTLKVNSPDLYSSSCFHLAKQFPHLSFTFYDKIARNHRYYAQAQFELASRHLAQYETTASLLGEEKQPSRLIPSLPDDQRQSHLALAFRHACRYGCAQAEAKEADPDMLLLRRIVTAMLAKDQDQHLMALTLPPAIESMLAILVKTFTTPEVQSQLELHIDNFLLKLEMHTLKTDNHSLKSQIDTLQSQVNTLSQQLSFIIPQLNPLTPASPKPLRAPAMTTAEIPASFSPTTPDFFRPAPHTTTATSGRALLKSRHEQKPGEPGAPGLT